MNKEQIEKAASKQAMGLVTLESTTKRELIKKGFISGAEWRINSAWHPATEPPKDGDYLTILHDNGNPVIEIAPWRNGKYQGNYYTGVYLGFVKVIKYANIYHLLPTE